MPNEPDSGLVESWIGDAQGGDEEAFDRLFRHYLPRIRRWALVRTGDVDDADDVVQRTMVQAYRNIQSYRGESSFASWLYAITSNAAKELSRGRASRVRAVERLRSEPRPEAVAPHADDRGELAGVVRMFLSELSPRQREMMDLVDLQGLQPAEAAELLGLEQSTARVHLLRGRRRMRECILQADPAFVKGLR